MTTLTDALRRRRRPDQRLLAATLRRALQLLFKPVAHPRVGIAAQRRWQEALARTNPGASGMPHHNMEAGGVRCRVYQPEGADTTVLYLHGGAYITGSPSTHHGLTSHLARHSQARVVVPDYRLAPEHPCPAAIEDAMAVYQTLLDQGTDPARLALAGDSAGGGLAVATLVALKQAHLPLPASLFLISPWVDLTLTRLFDTDRDVMLSQAWLADAARAYGGDHPERPQCSPINGDLAGLPPVLIQAGADEILLNDSHRLARAVRDAGGQVRVQVHPQRWHDFQLHAGLLADADLALRGGAGFLRHHFRQSDHPAAEQTRP